MLEGAGADDASSSLLIADRGLPQATDNQATLALNLIMRHGRATPLLWLTVDKDELKNHRNESRPTEAS